MADFADFYEEIQDEISALVRDLTDEELNRPIPATPGWTIRDLLAHLAGDVECANRGDFPTSFFMAFGQEDAVTVLNDWTAGHLSTRAGRSVDDLIDEWKRETAPLLEMFRGTRSWPDNFPEFAGAVLLTDITVHQHDIFGALGMQKNRDTAPVKIASAGYIRMIEMRLAIDGRDALGVMTEDKEWTAGSGEPAAAVRVPSRWELFRALSGRRNPDQVRAYEWQGDPEPYVRYFFPYGIRSEALVE